MWPKQFFSYAFRCIGQIETLTKKENCEVIKLSKFVLTCKHVMLGIESSRTCKFHGQVFGGGRQFP